MARCASYDAHLATALVGLRSLRGLFTPPEESYRRLCECDREASKTRRPWPTRNCWAIQAGGRGGKENPRTEKISTTNVVTKNACKLY